MKTINSNVLKLYKHHSITPLELINNFKKEHPQYREQKMSYAGRLDPMAEGLMIILVGDECHNKDHYLQLDKIYQLDLLWGISTDSNDILGLITQTKPDCNPSSRTIKQILPEFAKTFDQPYPPHSSKTINGKPLWQWYQQGKINKITIPTKKVTIQSIKLLSNTTISSQELNQTIHKKISPLNGNFNQDQILKQWKSFFNQTSQKSYSLTKIEVHCSSGTYMRSLAYNIGKNMTMPCLAYNIKRTQIGPHNLPKPHPHNPCSNKKHGQYTKQH